jgi:hypothetical protein
VKKIKYITRKANHDKKKKEFKQGGKVTKIRIQTLGKGGLDLIHEHMTSKKMIKRSIQTKRVA